MSRGALFPNLQGDIGDINATNNARFQQSINQSTATHSQAMQAFMAQIQKMREAAQRERIAKEQIEAQSKRGDQQLLASLLGTSTQAGLGFKKLGLIESEGEANRLNKQLEAAIGEGLVPPENIPGVQSFLPDEDPIPSGAPRDFIAGPGTFDPKFGKVPGVDIPNPRAPLAEIPDSFDPRRAIETLIQENLQKLPKRFGNSRDRIGNTVARLSDSLARMDANAPVPPEIAAIFNETGGVPPGTSTEIESKLNALGLGRERLKDATRPFSEELDEQAKRESVRTKSEDIANTQTLIDTLGTTSPPEQLLQAFEKVNILRKQGHVFDPGRDEKLRDLSNFSSNKIFTEIENFDLSNIPDGSSEETRVSELIAKLNNLNTVRGSTDIINRASTDIQNKIVEQFNLNPKQSFAKSAKQGRGLKQQRELQFGSNEAKRFARGFEIINEIRKKQNQPLLLPSSQLGFSGLPVQRSGKIVKIEMPLGFKQGTQEELDRILKILRSSE